MICVYIGVNKEIVDNLNLDDIMQSELDHQNEKSDNKSVYSEHDIVALNPELSHCINVEMQNLQSTKPPEPRIELLAEQYEQLLPTETKMATVDDVSCQYERQKCEVCMKKLIEKNETMKECVKQYAKLETIEMRDLSNTLEICSRMIIEELVTLRFPLIELSLTVLVEFQDRASEFAMIPFKEEEYKEFYDRHRNGMAISWKSIRPYFCAQK
jgi:hypothetical protein